MHNIHIKALGATTYEVHIAASQPTVHIVSVRPDYAKKLVGEKVPLEPLIKKSFEFLLERESNTSILRSFDLSVIARYFPDYERVIGEVCSQSTASGA